jgi:alginate O-acetyltransferase complex protein AlgJ
MEQKTANIYSSISTVIFLIILCLPLSNQVIGYYKDKDGEISKLENRVLAAKPAFSLKTIDSYPAAYEKWYNDHFLWRSSILRWHHLMSYFIFSKSPIPQKVAIGKDGWLFETDKERAFFIGAFTRSDEDIKKLIDELRDRTETYAKMGIKFYVLLAPMKQEIYPEKLPAYYRRSPNGTLTDKITAAIKKDPAINFIDCKAELLEQKKTQHVYYKTDNHWNELGGYYAYKTIINRLSLDFPALKPIPLTHIQFKKELRTGGNLATMMGLDFHLYEEHFSPKILQSKATAAAKRNYPVPPGFVKVAEYEMGFEQADKALPKAVFIRDSYGEDLIPYLKENFSRSLFIFDAWKYMFNKEIIEAEQPDIVVLEIFEPYIFNMLELD